MSGEALICIPAHLLTHSLTHHCVAMCLGMEVLAENLIGEDAVRHLIESFYGKCLRVKHAVSVCRCREIDPQA